MTTLINYAVKPSQMVIHPDGCLPSETLNYVVESSRVELTKRPRQSRPKPDDVTRHLTPLDKVYTTSAEFADQYSVEYLPCPHGGVHGVTEYRNYYTHWAFLGSYLYTDSEIDIPRWATKLREKVSSDRYNLSSSLAEYRESVKLFLSTVQAIHSGYKAIRRGDFSIFRNRKIRDIPASILYYNFGVAPLVEDLFSSVEVLRFRLNKPINRRKSVSVKLPKQVEIDDGSFRGTRVGLLKQRATIYYSIEPSFFLSQDFDIGNPIEWVWELIPFSFLVDQMIPIGEYLGVLDAMYGIVNLRGTVTSKVQERYVCNWVEADVRSRQFSGAYRSHSRAMIGSVPMPPLPKFEVSTSYKKLLNAISVLAVIRLK